MRSLSSFTLAKMSDSDFETPRRQIMTVTRVLPIISGTQNGAKIYERKITLMLQLVMSKFGGPRTTMMSTTSTP
jgi:hypothetical protein